MVGRAEVMTWCCFQMAKTPYPAPPTPTTMVRRPMAMIQRDMQYSPRTLTRQSTITCGAFGALVGALWRIRLALSKPVSCNHTKQYSDDGAANCSFEFTSNEAHHDADGKDTTKTSCDPADKLTE